MPPKLPFMTEKSFEYWIELDIYPRLAERLVRRAQSMLGLRSYNELLDSLSDVIGKDIHARIVKDDVPLLRTHPQESESGEETLVVHPDHPLNGVFRRVGEELRDNAPTCLGVGQSAVKFSKALRCLREMEGMTEAVRKSGRYITRLRELSRYHKDILKWTELILIGINPQS